jgi:hypothetical protein
MVLAWSVEILYWIAIFVVAWLFFRKPQWNA